MSPEQRRSMRIGGTALLFYFGVILLQSALTNVIDEGQWHFFNYSVAWVLHGAGIAAATWFALGDGRWFVRGATCLTLLIWIWIVWQAGVLVMKYQPEAHTSWLFIAAGSTLFFVSAVFLATARLLGGMSLVRTPDRPSIIELPRTFTLKQVLLFVTAVAATLAAARFVAPPQIDKWESFSVVLLQMQRERLGLLVWVTAYCVVVIPTATLFVFYPRWLLLTAVYFACACLAAVIIEKWYFGVLSRAMQSLNHWWPNTMKQSGAMLWHTVALFVTLRLLGYRLRWSGRRGFRNAPP